MIENNFNEIVLFPHEQGLFNTFGMSWRCILKIYDVF
jgi:hypothetical protein